MNETIKVLKIPTENVELEMWYMLRNFTSTKYIQKYFDEVKIEFSDELCLKISSSINQAQEYFEASKNVSLFTSPLLLYYGMTNLLYSLTMLKSGKVHDIKNHGMKICDEVSLSNHTSIGDITFQIQEIEKGGFFVFFDTLKSDFEKYFNSVWSIKDVLSSIPEFKNVFEECYENERPHVLPIIIYEDYDYTIEKISLSETDRFDNKLEIQERIHKLKENYLKPNIGKNFIVFRRKLLGKDIGVYSLSGQKFFQLVHLKNGKEIAFPILIYYLMGLYSFGTLSRYHPDLWNEFIKNDLSNEKLIIDRFVNYCRRAIPNLILNNLYNKRIIFTYPSEAIENVKNEITEKRIKNFIQEEINRTK